MGGSALVEPSRELRVRLLLVEPRGRGRHRGGRELERHGREQRAQQERLLLHWAFAWWLVTRLQRVSSKSSLLLTLIEANCVR